jgi:hypothetical protein
MARLGERHGTAWTPEEDLRLREAYLDGMTVPELVARHQRGRGAIRSRLVKLGLLEPHGIGKTGASASVQSPDAMDAGNSSGTTHSEIASSPANTTLTSPPAPTLESSPPPVVIARYDPKRVIRQIEVLISQLTTLKAHAELGELPRRALGAVATAYEGLETSLLSGSVETNTVGGTPADDPIPDRLRTELRRVVTACIKQPKDRYTAMRALGLVGDGKPWTLAAIGLVLGVTRERIRQRKVRAFKRINANLARQIATAARLREVLTEVASSMDWSDPEATASLIVTYVTSHFVAAKQLTLICCKAAGNHTLELNDLAGRAAARACTNPELLGEWRLDRWQDAATKAVGPLQHYDAPPSGLIGRKRTPAAPRDKNMQILRSRKLRRDVACESGAEFLVFSWMERSPQVLWYQEQPTFVPYRLRGRKKPYFPDAAVLDDQGRLVIVEVKPIFTICREETLIKALAALEAFGPQGIGYLLIDPAGRTVADLAQVPYSPAAAEQVEVLFENGPVPYGAVIRELSQLGAPTDFAAFGSIVVNRDWAVTTESPVMVSRLPRDQSFRPLLGSGASVEAPND